MSRYLKQGKYSYQQKDILGSGSFAKVYRGYDHHNSHFVALKQIQLKKLQRYGEDIKEIICNEINVMRKFTKRINEISCPYLVKNEDCFRTDQHIYIVLQFCDGGSLLDYTFGKKLSLQECITIIYHIACGIVYLSEIGIVHRDLKPQNIFLKHELINGVKQTFFKIGDFGFAAQKETFTTTLGTYPYMAPQIFKKQEYGIKADIWSLGVISHEIIFKEIYFIGKDKWEIAKNVKEKQYNLLPDHKVNINPVIEQFLKVCLMKDQHQRIGPKELLDHAIFNSLKNKSNQEKMSIFHRIYQLQQDCALYKTMAQKFHNFGVTMHRKTQFIEIYLLKQAYVKFNRLGYSIFHKENHLGIEQQDYKQLFCLENQSEYQKLKQRLQKQCNILSIMFSEKYKQFCKYILKFKPEEQQIIHKVVNQEPYGNINSSILRQQIEKWMKLLEKIQNDHKDNKELLKGCKRLIDA